MSNIIYLIAILGVAFYSIATGFRRGITGQIPSLLGFGFGAVAAQVFTPPYSENFQWFERFSQAPEFNDFTVSLICAVTIYFVVYWVFYLLFSLLGRILAFIEVGMFNRIVGAFYSLFKNLLWLSIVFNLLLCLLPSSGLMRYETADDGNLMAAVMALTPGILGCEGAEDFAHFHQLKEAKTISCNYRDAEIVILAKG